MTEQNRHGAPLTQTGLLDHAVCVKPASSPHDAIEVRLRMRLRSKELLEKHPSSSGGHVKKCQTCLFPVNVKIYRGD